MEEAFLRIKNLTKRFGGIIAVDECNLEVQPKSITGMIGPNGSGKTTTIDLICGMQRPDSGEIRFKGERINGLASYKIARKGIARSFQITRVFRLLTVLENMIIPMLKHRGIAFFTKAMLENERQRAREILNFVGIAELETLNAGNLSYGQQKLLELALALMIEPDLILLDEPAGGVNPVMQEKMVERIRELNKAGKTFLIIEHDMNFVMNLCDPIVVLDHGSKIAEGPPREIQKNSQVLDAYLGA